MSHHQFREVAPPERAPVHQIAETLGLCDGLSAERAKSQFRCANCDQMQCAGSWQVWVPDGVRKADPLWSVTETARRRALNGSWSGWCFDCAPKQAITVRSQKRVESAWTQWLGFWARVWNR